MDDLLKRSAAVRAPSALLPQNCDMRKWAVVACDQFTSDRKYWESLDFFVGDAPSSLRLILPECYLDESDVAVRRTNIESAMKTYVSGGLFKEVRSYIFVKRTFKSGKVRRGLIAEIDLEQYDFKPSSRALIRATEGTVESRLPPRAAIRKNSPLEIPHILLLADDPKNILFSAVEKSECEKLYDFELCCGGGHICGFAVAQTESVDIAFKTLESDTAARCGENLFLLAGDGNHSLAAAKLCYEQAKACGDASAELKRYALCEIVNLYDDGIEFEPIHRAVFGVNPQEFTKVLQNESKDFSVGAVAFGGGKEYAFALPAKPIEAVAFVQRVAEEYAERYGAKIDYIHGDEAVRELGKLPDCVAIELPPVSKSGFTEYIIKNGILPKKTFSMGSAEEKRYYLEARIIG